MMQQQPSHNSLWFLIARSLSGEATAEEEQILQQLLQHDAALQQEYDLLKRMWYAEKHAEGNINQQEKENLSRIIELASREKIHESIEEHFVIPSKKNKTFFFVAGSAAAVIIIAGVWFFTNNNNDTLKKNIPTQTLVADKGSRTRTILPDGSAVWLNADSHITYNENFSGATREVKLEGEAYFDVVKQAQRPFVVHVAGYDIKVLGTAFNVKSYPCDKTVETTLLRGMIEVIKQGNKKQKPIYLHPNEKLIVEKFAANNEPALPNNTQVVIPEKDYTVAVLDSTIKEKERIETAWVYNRLEFRGESFEKLAEKLERWYNVTIFFEDDAVKKLNFNGSFENETIEQALAALKTASSFQYWILGKEIHIKSIVKNK